MSASISVAEHAATIRFARPVKFDPLAPRLGDTDRELSILEALARIPPHEWIPGKRIAALCDIDDPNNGHFKATLAKFVKQGRLISNKNLGYRVAFPGSSPSDPVVIAEIQRWVHTFLENIEKTVIERIECAFPPGRELFRGTDVSESPCSELADARLIGRHCTGHEQTASPLKVEESSPPGWSERECTIPFGLSPFPALAGQVRTK